MDTKPTRKTILLAEDDPDDIYLISEAVAECSLDAQLNVVQDGEELLDYLFQRNKYAGEAVARPDLILLDLNMPLVDGREALLEIKKNQALATIPVIILTTSSADDDLNRSYQSGASGFVTKPLSFNELRETINRIGAYWLGTVRLPEAHTGEEGAENLA